MANLLMKVFGSRNQRLIRQYDKVVIRATELEAELESLSDDELRAKSQEFKKRLEDGAELKSLLAEAFAVVREASKRTLGLRHFDVQLIGGLVLFDGNIAEMRTGEGKTLVATLPAYVNALAGIPVHIVTVNDYLATRDANWMRPIYEFLGLSVGIIHGGQASSDKREAYLADVTYGTNNEFGFDYLRDNLVQHKQDQMQRSLGFAVVDEVDSILIDEARTPLIISGPSNESSTLYIRINKLIPKLRLHSEPEGPTNADIKSKRISLIDEKGQPVMASGGDGTEQGVMTLDEAIELASDRSADVVMTNKEGEFPVCKLVVRGDFTIEEKTKQAFLTEKGHETVEKLLALDGLIGPNESLYDAGNIRLVHHIMGGLRAHALYKCDVEYVVQDGEIVIVDEFTGRTMPGRRWGDGLHQAVEAKEGVVVNEENLTVASITFQNYFRMYQTLSGMTGTADTEAFEFQQIYGLEVVVIPTHRQMIREDQPDLVFLTQKDKFKAIIEDIEECQKKGQPVLVGTTSIETSEYLSGLLKREGMKHEVLNAKQHEREAHIVENAGRVGAVTIATIMAGRGTDIVLGGNLEAEIKALGGDSEPDPDQVAKIKADWKDRHQAVLDAGGLHIVGTERHESRRIDNQLRGRSGRQGDPGSSRFYLSMEDSLMRIFGDPDRTKNMLTRVGMKEGEAIESKLLTRQIERAQRKVEAHNFDMRKSLLEYDDVANDQRSVVYQQRNELMEAEDLSDAIAGIRDEVVSVIVAEYVPNGATVEEWDLGGLEQALKSDFGANIDLTEIVEQNQGIDEDKIREMICNTIDAEYERKVNEIGPDIMRQFEKVVMLSQLDAHWKEHLAALDYLRQGIHLRGYAQKDPKKEYKREAFEMFGSTLDQVKKSVTSILTRAQLRSEEDVEALEERGQRQNMRYQHAEASSAIGESAGDQQAEPFVRNNRKVGRNEPCPCGSGKKFKRCHGLLN